jgi:murein DD-endopeptidase MepM/ murein hydrolase activator NlpD
MDSERPGQRTADDDPELTRVRNDPRFDDETRQRARAVVPLDEGVRVAQPSPAARQIARQRALIVVLFLAVLFLIAALVWVLQTRYGATPVTPITQPPPTVEPTATPTPTPSLSPSPSVSPTVEASPGVSPSISPGVSPSPDANASPGATPAASPPPQVTQTPATSSSSNSNAQLLIPVAGVRAEQLTDTYTQARSEGRVHNAIDIMAAKGTPVLAAADGTVVRLFQSDKGGTTLYVRGTDNRTIYYYAHLSAYAEGITENKFVRRGDLIAYVGDTGNAGAGNFHLHFAIWTTDDPKRYFDGANVNPYPLLTGKR